MSRLHASSFITRKRGQRGTPGCQRAGHHPVCSCGEPSGSRLLPETSFRRVSNEYHPMTSRLDWSRWRKGIPRIGLRTIPTRSRAYRTVPRRSASSALRGASCFRCCRETTPFRTNSPCRRRHRSSPRGRRTPIPPLLADASRTPTPRLPSG